MPPPAVVFMMLMVDPLETTIVAKAPSLNTPNEVSPAPSNGTPPAVGANPLKMIGVTVGPPERAIVWRTLPGWRLTRFAVVPFRSHSTKNSWIVVALTVSTAAGAGLGGLISVCAAPASVLVNVLAQVL